MGQVNEQQTKPEEIMERIYANAGNCQGTINDVMRSVGSAASLRRAGAGYVISDAGVDLVEIVTYTRESHFVESAGELHCTSVGPVRLCG